VDAVDVVGSLVSGPPAITGVSPAMGSTAGGTSVTITGARFTGATAVTFGGVNATSYTVNSATQITAVAPAHTAGTVGVQVVTPSGSSPNTAADDYTYAQPVVPTITGLSPTSGVGGTSVVITGSNFTGVTAVTFGGTAATSYTVTDSSHITATAPAHAAGSVRVQVTAFGGTTADTAADDFTYTTPPVATRFDQTDSRISYAGTWTPFAKDTAYGRSYGRANTSGASATIYFNGTRLDWIAMKGTTTGKADVYLDDVFQRTVDLANPIALYQVNVYSTDVLAEGVHKLEIRWNTTAANVGKYITVDAVDVVGSLVSGP
jgi:hypothetical protein